MHFSIYSEKCVFLLEFKYIVGLLALRSTYV